MEKAKPWAVLALSVLYFICLSAASYYKENGFREIQRLSAAIADVSKATDQLADENLRYSKELAQLNASDRYVEEIARENLGLVKPGELVFEFVDVEKLTPPSSPAVMELAGDNH